jgi:hypothetical protein
MNPAGEEGPNNDHYDVAEHIEPTGGVAMIDDEGKTIAEGAKSSEVDEKRMTMTNYLRKKGDGAAPGALEEFRKRQKNLNFEA